MKGITFFKIFKILFCIFIFMGFLCVRHVFIADAADVVEKITYNTTTGEYTYEYTLTNSGDIPIYWWGIFYEEDPNAIFPGLDDAGVYCDDGWRNNGLDLLGGFMTYPDPDPSGSGTGYLSTSAIGFASGNPQEFIYSDNGTDWYNQADYDALIGGGANPADYYQATIGGGFGWTGDSADIQTNYGIGEGEQGTYTMKSEENFDGDKTFFYNTIAYWNAWTYDDGTPLDYTDDESVFGGFEETGTTTAYVAPSSGGGGGGGGTTWGWPTWNQGFLTGYGGYQPATFYQPSLFQASFQQSWFQSSYTPSFQQQLYQPFQQQQWYQPSQQQQWYQPFQQQQWYQPFQQQWYQPFQQQQWYQPQSWNSQQQWYQPSQQWGSW